MSQPVTPEFVTSRGSESTYPLGGINRFLRFSFFVLFIILDFQLVRHAGTPEAALECQSALGLIR